MRTEITWQNIERVSYALRGDVIVAVVAKGILDQDALIPASRATDLSTSPGGASVGGSAYVLVLAGRPRDRFYIGPLDDPEGAVRTADAIVKRSLAQP